MKRILITVTLIIFGFSIVWSQSNLSIAVHGLGFGLKKNEYKELFENNIDSEGHAIFQPGVVLSYEFFVLELDHSIMLQQGITIDIAAQFAAYSRIMYRLRVWKYLRHTINFGVGPSIYYRDNWDRFDEYHDHGDLNDAGGLEYKFMPITGEISYDFYISNKSDLSLTFYYAQPKVISFSIGYRYWINTKIKHKKRCNTCFYGK